GLVLYMLVARPRGLLSGVLATAPIGAALIVIAYRANLLDTVDPTPPAAVAQGPRVALAAAICAAACAGLRLLLAIGLDPRLRSFRGRPPMRRGTRRAAIAGVLAAAVVAALALNVPHGLAHDWQRFIGGGAPAANTS